MKPITAHAAQTFSLFAQSCLSGCLERSRSKIFKRTFKIASSRKAPLLSSRIDFLSHGLTRDAEQAMEPRWTHRLLLCYPLESEL
jgi:hypothetical protein